MPRDKSQLPVSRDGISGLHPSLDLEPCNNSLVSGNRCPYDSQNLFIHSPLGNKLTLPLDTTFRLCGRTISFDPGALLESACVASSVVLPRDLIIAGCTNGLLIDLNSVVDVYEAITTLLYRITEAT